MPFDPNTLSTVVYVVTGFAAAFGVALWVSMLIWTYRDVRKRSRDRLLRILAVLIVAVLFLPGVLVYLILRTPHTLEEEYQQTLEEEALLQSIEETPLCPGCSRRIRDDWIVCPNCHTKLKKTCHQCGRFIELPWNICPFCGTPAPGMRRENMTMDEVLSSLPTDVVE
jgi:RNA polymerase subunit RPABC4/transcription elongation factor Spt4